MQAQTSVGSRIMIKLSDTWQTVVVQRLEYLHPGCGWPGITDTLLYNTIFFMQLNTVMKDRQTSLKPLVCLTRILDEIEFNCGLVFRAVIRQKVRALCLHAGTLSFF